MIAMATRNKFRRARIGRRSRQPVIVVVFIAMLAAAALAGAGLVAIPLWTALVQGWRFQPVVEECSILQDAGARKACYDNRTDQHPAKGANAPIVLRSPDDISR
jgi:hypothetical protein